MSENTVARHYASPSLHQRVLDALVAAGVDAERPSVDELAGVDEFHLGGRAATAWLGEQLELAAGQRVLDIGSGLGGPARYLAAHYAVSVAGIDLTPEFVEVAAALTRRVGLTDRVRFSVGSATALPFPDGSFERAYLIHVGMNIEAKAALFAQAHRVLGPGGCLAVYDVMRRGPGSLAFPVPWAADAASSFVTEPREYRELLVGAGFEVVDEREFVGSAGAGRPVAMGADADTKVSNLVANIRAGLVAPTLIVARRS